MDYFGINEKVGNLSKNSDFNVSQIEAIKYACYIPNFDENLIIDSSIPSDIMLTYIKLATTMKIDISYYIKNSWHLKGYDSNQLYYLIVYHNKGYDISAINPHMTINEINNIIKEQEKSNLLTLEKNSINLDKSIIDLLKSLDLKVSKFLLKKIKQGEDMSDLLKEKLKDFSFEQVKYLYSIHSIGENIEPIFDSNLSVEQMKEKMLNSPFSQEFLQSISENNKSRKK